MFKTLSAGIALISGASASNYANQYGTRVRNSQRWEVPNTENYLTHNRVWGHTHYEPGDVDRFENHYADIYGADDLAWGPNGY